MLVKLLLNNITYLLPPKKTKKQNHIEMEKLLKLNMVTKVHISLQSAVLDRLHSSWLQRKHFLLYHFCVVSGSGSAAAPPQTV